MSTSSETNRGSNKSPAAEIPLVEWIIGATGLMIVTFAVGVLIYEAVSGDKSPPDVKLTVLSMGPLRNGFLVKIRAENEGGEPAARVAILAELMQKAQVLEVSETGFESLPPRSSREAGVFFVRDPRQGEVRLTARGYQVP